MKFSESTRNRISTLFFIRIFDLGLKKNLAAKFWIFEKILEFGRQIFLRPKSKIRI